MLLLGALLAPAASAHAAVTANVVNNTLRVTGDDADNLIMLRLVAGDNTRVEVFEDAVVSVGRFARATFATIVVIGGAGDDTISIDEFNGVFTDAHQTALIGGDGADFILGGSGGEVLEGENSDDDLVGGGGNDFLVGGDGNDRLEGGPGDDPHIGGPGDDLMIWFQGDGSDVIEGGVGDDRLSFNGSNAAERMTATRNGNRVSFTRDLGNILMDIGTTERLAVAAFGGNDNVTMNNDLALAGLTVVLINGGDGNDTITGGNGAENIGGGGGDDGIFGGAGSDRLAGGPGNDTIGWVPGDGSDLIEGDEGSDQLVFFGADVDEVMAATANAGRVRFTRDIGGIGMDIGTIESLVVSAFGGNDTVTVGNDLALAGLTSVAIFGGDGNDTIVGGNIDSSLAGGAGDDTLNGGAGNEALQGDAGNDNITGGAGTDILDGGDGNDRLAGGPANGLEFHIGGPGNDLVVWNQGDGSDQIEGGDGNDTLVFNGFAGNELMAATANAGVVTFTRDLGNIVMSIRTTENLTVNALGGNDTVTVGNDLAAAGLTQVTIDGGDGADAIAGGNGVESLIGGAGDDSLAGGAGVDLLDGGPGNDILVGGPGGQPLNLERHIGGPGNDTTIWNPGDGSDLTEGGDGDDTLLFNGADADEVMAAVANAGRVTFTRTPGNIVMDIGTTEHLTVNALGGNDTIAANAGLAALIDIAIRAGAGVDTITSFASTNITLNGNTEEDTLNFDAERQAVSQSPSSIAVGGATRVTHAQVEHINVRNGIGEPPTIAITSPTADPTTTSSSPLITLAGTATDAKGNGSVTWTNDRGGSGAAVGTTNWTAADIPLQSGVNILSVTVEDADGNQTSDQLTVTVAAFLYTMAEGSTGAFFDTDILLANPNSVEAPVTITYVKGDGTTVNQNLTLAPTSRTTVEVDKVAGLEAAELSATVTSTAALPLAVERTMRWDATGYGAHTEKATNEPARTWYFAEGAQGYYETFLLLANPGPRENVATVQFLLQSGAPVTRTFTLAPTSRQTVHAGSIDALKDQAFGAIVTFTEPGMAERAMYFGTPVFNAGHESAGVTAPASEWFLAEGATGTFFTTFVLVANPGDTAGTVTYTYLPDHGAAVTKTREIGPRQRLTVNVAEEDGTLANAAVATRVVSTVPVLAERAQYWPSTPDQWNEAHNSFGSTSVSPKWGLAEGRVGGTQGYQTFILLANANETHAADVRVTFLRANGSTVVKTVTVNPETRFTLHVNTLAPELVNESFGALIEVTNGIGIFVERAMYSDVAGVIFAAGTNALATQLP